MLGFLPGMSLEDAVNREILNRQYTDDRSQSTNYNWQDKFGGFLGGYNRADVEREMQKRLDRDVKREFNEKYTDTAERLGDQLNPLYTGEVKGLTRAQIIKQQTQDARRADLLEQIKAIPGNENITINPNARSSTLRGMLTTATDKRRTALLSEPGGPLDMLRRSDDRYNQQRLDLLERELRQDKNRERNRQQEMKLQMMQYDLQNRRLDMQEARNFRQDRQKAIMQIMQGFRQMGNAFAY